jgi:outer membrane protein
MTIGKFTFASAIAASALIASTAPASAQSRLPAPVVAVVDAQRVMSDCNACKQAQAQLQAQLNQMQQFAQQLAAPLDTEAQQLDAALKAANNRPDAALQTRIQTFRGKQENAQRQVQEQQQTLERNAAFVRQQIGVKLIPVIDQISQQRGATVTIDKGSLLFAAPTLDITDGVLASLNQQLTTVNVVAPPPAPQGTAPAPRPAAATPARTNPQTPPPGR